jgi:two-component system, NarL family, response regulator NreC
LTTLALADDETVVRQAIRCYLEQHRDFRIVGESADGLGVASLVRKVRPDVLIMAVALPGIFGLEVARMVRDESPNTRVIMLTRYVNEWYVTESLRNGASGYVLKQATAHHLVRAIRTVSRGRRFLSPPLSNTLVDRWLRAERTGPDPYDRLTTRERQVLHLVAAGESARQIAGRLEISVRTAEAHRANAMQKLGIEHQAGLIRYALGRSILSPAEAISPQIRPIPG